MNVKKCLIPVAIIIGLPLLMGATYGPCNPGDQCAEDSNCSSGVCTGEAPGQYGVCAAPTCNDGVANGYETDVDCGNSVSNPQVLCKACTTGQRCLINTDCQSGVCAGNTTGAGGTCAAPACNDGVKNGAETDVDCGGGGSCSRCGYDQHCLINSDCWGSSECLYKASLGFKACT